MEDNNTNIFQKLRKLEKSLLSFFFFIPYSLLFILLIFLLSYNGASIFCVHVPFPAKPSDSGDFFTENSSSGQSPKRVFSSASKAPALFAVKEDFPPLQKSVVLKPVSLLKVKWKRRNRAMLRTLRPTAVSNRFSVRAKEFFHGSCLNFSNSYNSSRCGCKIRFFLTWISSIELFGYRELFSLESVFKFHSNACVLIVSSSLDSSRGEELLRPFRERGFRVTAISPDFNYIFKNTLAEVWFDRLRKGSVEPGEVSLGQNISNLLRLVLLYKFGGVYIDTDVIVLRSFVKLRNVIGAQTTDLETGNWSRLNNAVMIFDKKHPLLLKFIEEFALTFDGNRWGHNGPYLVSRVVSRIGVRQEFDDFTVLPPMAFYPVDWSRVQGFFHGPRDAVQSKWIVSKFKRVQRESFAVHLWNKHSRNLNVEEGSIIHRLVLDTCVFCNSLAQAM
ncbi:hypothetical protein Sjap_000187 [Stephania japonica]|uniref:Alpha 1,4-glycosyltransferase domain-containing protein n=1 Tax=Stephania japonica TaxID=461633 RepID=A0AAP0PQH6_9MAGN